MCNKGEKRDVMTKEEKDKLVGIYHEIRDKNYYYFDLDSFEREQIGRNIGFFNEPEEYQIEMWLKLLGGVDYNLLYLDRKSVV